MILMRKRYILGGRAACKNSIAWQGNARMTIYHHALYRRRYDQESDPTRNCKSVTLVLPHSPVGLFLSQEPESLTTAPKPQIPAQTSPTYCYNLSDLSYTTAHILVHTRHSLASRHARNHTVMGIARQRVKLAHAVHPKQRSAVAHHASPSPSAVSQQSIHGHVMPSSELQVLRLRKLSILRKLPSDATGAPSFGYTEVTSHQSPHIFQ